MNLMQRASRKVEPLEEDEGLLIEAARAGERRAAQVLYSRYQEQVWRVVYRLVLDHEEALDICQETWMKAFGSLSRFRTESRFGTWITRIAVNSAYSRMRTASWRGRRNQATVDEELETFPSRFPDPRESLEERYHHEIVEDAILDLSPNQRQALVLRYFGDLPLAEIAGIMECREGSVKSHLHRAVEALRKKLAGLFPEKEEKNASSKQS
jgi:RNA polymerase sigma-70 factor, ECF subfamily